MRNLSFRRLSVFAAVARLGSVSAAARELHLTQPAVSKQVKELEESVGLPLTERIGRRIDLTAAGREMARLSQRVADQILATEAALDALKGLHTGRVDIGAVSTSKYFAPRLLAAFRHEHPEVELKLGIANRAEVVQWLEGNTVDLAIMGSPPQHLECIATRMAEHPLAWFAAPDHPLAHEVSIDAAVLTGESLLVREPGSGTRSAMDRFLVSHQLAPPVMLEMSSNETIKQAVMAGMGIAFLSEHTAGLELATHQLVRLPVANTPVLRQWYVVHRAEKRLLPASIALRDFLVTHGARLIALQMDPLGTGAISRAALAERELPLARPARHSARRHADAVLPAPVTPDTGNG